MFYTLFHRIKYKLIYLFRNYLKIVRIHHNHQCCYFYYYYFARNPQNTQYLYYYNQILECLNRWILSISFLIHLYRNNNARRSDSRCEREFLSAYIHNILWGKPYIKFRLLYDGCIGGRVLWPMLVIWLIVMNFHFNFNFICYLFLLILLNLLHRFIWTRYYLFFKALILHNCRVLDWVQVGTRTGYWFFITTYFYQFKICWDNKLKYWEVCGK